MTNCDLPGASKTRPQASCRTRFAGKVTVHGVVAVNSSKKHRVNRHPRAGGDPENLRKHIPLPLDSRLRGNDSVNGYRERL